MSPEKIVGLIGLVVVIISVVVLVVRKLPKRVKTKQYIRKWRDIQQLCGNKEDWSHAIVHADMLLDEVLKKKKVPGKTTGERMVNVQAKFSTNEMIWNAHKLANSLRHDGARVMREEEVKSALVAFRQALRDLGAL